MKFDADQRRDALYFLVGPALAAVLIAALFHVHPWPTALAAQAANFGWLVTLGYLGVGLVGVFLSSRIGCPAAPPLDDGRGWRKVIFWGLGIGLLEGLWGVAKTALPPFGPHYEALDRAAGFTWGNVALPRSVPH